MHKPGHWHLTQVLPGICHHAISLDAGQWRVVKSTKDVDFLGLEHSYCEMGTSRMVHRADFSPTVRKLVIFLNRIQVVLTIEPSNRIYSVG